METTNLIIEIDNDYARTMNKIIFDRYLEENSELTDELYPAHLILPEEEEKETPYFGMMPLER